MGIFGNYSCVATGCREPVVEMTREILPEGARVFMCQAHRDNWFGHPEHRPRIHAYGGASPTPGLIYMKCSCGWRGDDHPPAGEEAAIAELERHLDEQS